ncbi:MAG: lasso peptide biosynthesis B2 protein [Nitrospira sp.]|nr:MAG: lasso peptide biosynthesis B2 protein [Nitrospira sp.]
MIKSFPLDFYGVPNITCRASVTDGVMCRAIDPGVSKEAGYRQPSMMHYVKKYWTLVRVGLIVSWIRLLLRLKTLPLVLDWLSPRSMTGSPDEGVMGDLVYYVDRWLQVFPYNTKGNCFPRSLALFWFARRLGYPVLFCCGVRKEGSSLDGHAWLVLNHQPFHESSQHCQLFAVTFSYPSDTRIDTR